MAEARVDEAVAARARERWLAQAASEDATWLGLLHSLAESGVEVGLQLGDARRVIGQVAAIGADFVAVSADAAVVLLALNAVHGVAIDGRRSLSARPAAGGQVRLVDVLGRLAAEERWCRVSTAGTQVAGCLVACGSDVVTMVVDDGPTLYLPVASISEVTLPSRRA